MPHHAYLYWCETDDHDEDWFVVAPSIRIARRFFEDHEGYDRGDCVALRVARVPASVTLKTNPCWPRDELFRACGGELVTYKPAGGQVDDEMRRMMGVVTKAVRFGDRVYVAGDIVANQAAREGHAVAN